METALKIYTDGGCLGNPGPGGWAYTMVQTEAVPNGDTIVAEDKGAEQNTTNNRMELTAVISALKALKMRNRGSTSGCPRQLRVYTDSQYVQKGITEWIITWKRNSWRTSDKKPVKNQDLWMELDALAAELSPGWEWVRGHAGNEFNERCDRMTQEAIALLR
ncbi:MAG: ribonuclease HI [Treponema sp.]|jgi:ribonuclease HI|nr:ribonuclease HI [Treponema sp.]